MASKYLEQAEKQIAAEARHAAIQEVGEALLAALKRLGFNAEGNAAATWRKVTVIDHSNIGSRPRPARRRASSAGIRPGTDQARVLNAVRTWPGNKGFQIRTLLAGTGHVIQERTLRTSLRRLSKKRGLIEQREDGTWHPKGHQE